MSQSVWCSQATPTRAPFANRPAPGPSDAIVPTTWWPGMIGDLRCGSSPSTTWPDPDSVATYAANVHADQDFAVSRLWYGNVGIAQRSGFNRTGRGQQARLHLVGRHRPQFSPACLRPVSNGRRHEQNRRKLSAISKESGRRNFGGNVGLRAPGRRSQRTTSPSLEPS